MERDDLELIARFLAHGDREAMGELLARYRSACFGLALHMTRSNADAEDACQEAALSAVRCVESFDPSGGSFRAWIMRLTHNAAMMRIRSDRARSRREINRAAMDAAAADPSPQAAIARAEESELTEAVRVALAELSERYRVPVVLCHVQGLSSREAAGVLGMSEGVVRTYVARGLRKLRKHLAAAGFALAPAAVAGLLKPAGAVSVPAALVAVLNRIAATALPLPRAAAASQVLGLERGVAKGGMTMKVVAGILMVGALTGAAVSVNRAMVRPEVPRPTLAAAPKNGDRAAPDAGGKGALKIEHFAFCYAGHMYLDGPGKEACCPTGRPGPGLIDEGGNVWFGMGTDPWGAVGGRCLRKEDGVLLPYFGDDYWCSVFPEDEGPGAAMFTTLKNVGLGLPEDSQFVWGSPLEGGDKGFLLFADGSVVRKVFRNPEKENRWWFKRIMGGGTKPLPMSKGGEVGALDVKMGVRGVQVMPDGRIVAFAAGGFYELKGDKLVCLAGYDDYKGAGVIPEKNGQTDVPEQGVMGGDGTFYFGTYFGTGFGGSSPCVWRIVPGGKIEPYAWAVVNTRLDGPGMYSGAMCGHHIWGRQHNYRYVPADCLFLVAHDGFWVRRLRDGRVTTLCEDAEWHEAPSIPGGYRWFHNWAAGPGGMITAESKKTGKGAHTTTVTYVVRGVDFGKATVGPAIETPGLTWPPPPDFKTRGEKKSAKKSGKGDDEGGEE